MQKSIVVKPATSAPSPSGLTFQGTVEIPLNAVRKVSIGKSGVKVRSFLAQLSQLSALLLTLPNGQEKADRMAQKSDLIRVLGEETKEYYQPRRLWGLKDDAFSQVSMSPFVQGEISSDGKTLVLGMYSALKQTTQIVVETNNGVYDVLAGHDIPDRLACAKIEPDGKSDLIKSPPKDALFEARSAESKAFNNRPHIKSVQSRK